MSVYFVERNSWIPSKPPSRPIPDCFMPPNGAAAFDTRPVSVSYTHLDVYKRQLARLVRFNELGNVQNRITPEVLDEVYSMSAATIDRYLKPYKDAQLPVALSGTKPSHILRSQIPIRTAMDGTPNDPGFYELDTVAHCGHTLKGEHLWTLTATNPKYGWTILRTCLLYTSRCV